MREIKFRAFYDGTMMYNVVRVGNALYWDDGKCFDVFAFKQKDPAVLMQYIGYKDVVGFDIYESDILKDDFGRILLVQWYQGGFAFRALTATNFKQTTQIIQWFDGCSTLPKIVSDIYKDDEYQWMVGING